MIEFIKKNFNYLPENKLCLQYPDSEGDLITLANQQDLDALLENNTEGYIKVKITIEG